MITLRTVILLALFSLQAACDTSAQSGPQDGAAAGDAGAAPALQVTLKPSASDEALDRLDVELVVEAPDLEAGETFLRMPVNIVSTPTTAYEAKDIAVSDARGEVSLTSVDEEPTPTGTYRHWVVDRPTSGDVTVRYGTAPRAVDAGTRNGPLFDLRQRGGGLIGAGVYFFALPVSEEPYAVSLEWDMSAAPPGTRGVWSLGEGPRELTIPADTLAFSYYAIGPVSSYPGDPAQEETFGMYWLDELPWDARELAANIEDMYRYMADFFGDTDSAYKVFVRENPYPGGGGSGLASSFMFSYGTDELSGDENPQMLIAHEIAHNWPHLNAGEPHALTAWYTEGNAEFYSAMLAYRGGIIDLDRFVETINEHARGYYTNPYVGVTNARAGELFWQDDRAQRVPYGRGFMYLAQVDGQLRAASGGRRSLDDLVRAVYQRQQQAGGEKGGEKIGNAEWAALVAAELGAEARAEFEAMTRGQLIVPGAATFGDCLSVVESREPVFELGFDRMSLGVVKDLRAGSAARRAGLQEGDNIVSLTPVKKLRNDIDRPMRMQVERDGEVIDIEYLPLGDDEVTVWQWQKNPAATAEDCAL